MDDEGEQAAEPEDDAKNIASSALFDKFDQAVEHQQQYWDVKEKESCYTAGKFKDFPLFPVCGLNFVQYQQCRIYDKNYGDYAHMTLLIYISIA